MVGGKAANCSIFLFLSLWRWCVHVDVKPLRFLYLLKVKESWLFSLADIPNSWQHSVLFICTLWVIACSVSQGKLLWPRGKVKNSPKQNYRPLCTILYYQIYKQPCARTNKELTRKTEENKSWRVWLSLVYILMVFISSLQHPKCCTLKILKHNVKNSFHKCIVLIKPQD